MSNKGVFQVPQVYVDSGHQRDYLQRNTAQQQRNAMLLLSSSREDCKQLTQRQFNTISTEHLNVHRGWPSCPGSTKYISPVRHGCFDVALQFNPSAIQHISLVLTCPLPKAVNHDRHASMQT